MAQLRTIQRASWIKSYTWHIFVCSVPDVGPVIVRAESTTFSSINVDWKIIPKEERNGHITMYEVDVLQQVGGTWETQLTNNFTKNLTAEIQNAVIQNLTMFVKYRIRVRAYTCKGPGPYSNQSKMLMTLETGNAFRPDKIHNNGSRWVSPIPLAFRKSPKCLQPFHWDKKKRKFNLTRLARNS